MSSSHGHSLDHLQSPDQYSGNTETDLRDVQSIDAAAKAVYEDLRPMLQDIIYLKRYRNSFRGYGSLPGELLLNIFRWCPEQRKTINDPCYAFSQVCHWWRVVAISEKTLWTTPDLLRPNLAIEMFNRSAPLPLRIYLPDVFASSAIKLSIPPDFHKRISSITASYSRVQSFDHESDQPEGILHQFLGQKSLPLLHTLTLKSGDDMSSDLLDTVYGTPLLRSVTFENCLPYWSAGFMTNLTSLTIVLKQKHLYRNLGYPIFEQIASVLKRNPNLVRLELKDVMSSGGRAKLIAPNPGSTAHIELARLERLKLADNIDVFARLLPLLKIPLASGVELQADMVRDEYGGHLLEGLGRALLRFLILNAWTTKFRFLLIRIGVLSELQMCERLQDNKCHGDWFELDVTLLRHDGELYAWSQALADSLLTLHFEEVEIERDRKAESQGVSMDHVCTALSKIPTLHTLVIRDKESKPQTVEDLIVALEPRPSDAPDAVQTFPALRLLTVKSLEMFRSRGILKSQRESVLEKLNSVINRRREAGENVPKIILEQCSFMEPLEILLDPKNMEILQPRIVETDGNGDDEETMLVAEFMNMEV